MENTQKVDFSAIGYNWKALNNIIHFVQKINNKLLLVNFITYK